MVHQGYTRKLFKIRVSLIVCRYKLCGSQTIHPTMIKKLHYYKHILPTHPIEIEVNTPADGISKCSESIKNIKQLSANECSNLLPFDDSFHFKVLLLTGPISFLHGVEFHIAINIALMTLEGVGSSHFNNSCSTQLRNWSPLL